MPAPQPSLPTSTESTHPHPVDVYVGNRLRLRRTMMQISQEQLAAEIDLTFQQIQKYERGANRISASKLFAISKALKTPISFFFAGLEQNESGEYTATNPEKTIVTEATKPVYAEDDPLTRRETLELITFYYRIPEAATRSHVFNLIKSMAADVPGRKPSTPPEIT